MAIYQHDLAIFKDKLVPITLSQTYGIFQKKGIKYLVENITLADKVLFESSFGKAVKHPIKTVSKLAQKGVNYVVKQAQTKVIAPIKKAVTTAKNIGKTAHKHIIKPVVKAVQKAVAGVKRGVTNTVKRHVAKVKQVYRAMQRATPKPIKKAIQRVTRPVARVARPIVRQASRFVAKARTFFRPQPRAKARKARTR